MLLTNEGKQSIEKDINENQGWMSNMFDSITTWNKHTSFGNGRTYMRCKGF